MALLSIAPALTFHEYSRCNRSIRPRYLISWLQSFYCDHMPRSCECDCKRHDQNPSRCRLRRIPPTATFRARYPKSGLNIPRGYSPPYISESTTTSTSPPFAKMARQHRGQSLRVLTIISSTTCFKFGARVLMMKRNNVLQVTSRRAKKGKWIQIVICRPILALGSFTVGVLRCFEMSFQWPFYFCLVYVLCKSIQSRFTSSAKRLWRHLAAKMRNSN